MMDEKNISQYLNDIQNHSVAESELDTFVGKLRETQLNTGIAWNSYIAGKQEKQKNGQVNGRQISSWNL